ncbi:hypothetical protein E308F_17380 [Moorella sp. E308F]|nr:hypothetical protein E308F_17380 [Moorella sp. E308F]GEA19648.1 hypothetical protein E306M_27860 [Moorella sp. E306M]
MGTELQELEARPNWVATFERTNPEARFRYDCLMCTLVDTYYWHTPDYTGLFAWGATRPCNLDLLREDLELGYKRLVRGTLPPEIVEKFCEVIPEV